MKGAGTEDLDCDLLFFTVPSCRMQNGPAYARERGLVAVAANRIRALPLTLTEMITNRLQFPFVRTPVLDPRSTGPREVSRPDQKAKLSNDFSCG
jgi:hypothetical protein